MKRITLLFSLLLATTFCGVLYAQQLELNVRYNFTDSRYEVYALPNDTDPNFSWGPSQISIVVPASVGDAAFSITSVVAGAWQDNSQVYAPAVTPGFDYHGVGSGGATTAVTAGVELLIFHFTIAGETCVDGIRLYNNGSDPTSSDAGMNGGDFTNTIIGVGVSVAGEAYIGNYNNDGITCDTDGDGTDDDEDDDPLDPCVDFTPGMEDPNNPIWGNADCDGDGVVNADEDSDATDPYDPCSLVL